MLTCVSPKRIATRSLLFLFFSSSIFSFYFCFSFLSLLLLLFLFSFSTFTFVSIFFLYFYFCSFSSSFSPLLSLPTIAQQQTNPYFFLFLERRWSSRTFRYGYLVTTSPQLSDLPSAAPSFQLGHRLRAFPTPMVWRAVCTRPGNVFTATFWFAITSDSSFM